MILVHKPTPFPLHPHHRRNPSSPPAVCVQPTHTPGLLRVKPAPPVSPSPAPRVRRTTPSQAEGSQHKQRQRRPIPIPAPATQPHQTARSVPLPHHRPAKRTAAPNPAPLLPPFDFPICDDLSDSEVAPPSTPTRPKHRRPAPSSSNSRPAPSNPPQHSKRPRNHKRAPSDSGMVFNMSSDEESSPFRQPTTNSSTSNDELDALFRNLAVARSGMRTPPPPQRREQMYEAMARREVAHYVGGIGHGSGPSIGTGTAPRRQGLGHGYFASSSFQNSPSPDELPDPLFV